MKVTERCAAQKDELVFICDFSPTRTAELAPLEPARDLDADFICVAYNPGRRVRVDSAMLAYSIKQNYAKDVIFNLATRDMNKLAIQSHVLGAQMLGLENVVVIQGDVFTEKDLSQVKDVRDYTPTGLMGALASMNQGLDFRGTKLKTPTNFDIGASIDLDRGMKKEAALTQRKANSGVDFFITQPVFSTYEINSFHEAYLSVAGAQITQPVFYGLQILQKDGILFSSVPQWIRDELAKGRQGTDIALEILEKFVEFGIRTVYLVPPILKGGARNYAAAQRLIEAATH